MGLEGYKSRLTKKNEQAEEVRKQFMAEGKTEQANLMTQSPDSLNGITTRHALLLTNDGIWNTGVPREAMKGDFWTRLISEMSTEEIMEYVQNAIRFIKERGTKPQLPQV